MPPRRQHPLPALSSLVPEQAFLLSSFSKVMAPGLRVGYLEASPQWLDKVAASIRADCWMVAPLMPEIVTDWLESGVGRPADRPAAPAHRRAAGAGAALPAGPSVALGARPAPPVPAAARPLADRHLRAVPAPGRRAGAHDGAFRGRPHRRRRMPCASASTRRVRRSNCAMACAPLPGCCMATAHRRRPSAERELTRKAAPARRIPVRSAPRWAARSPRP